MDPARKCYMRVGEQRHHVGQAAVASRRARPMGQDQGAVGHRHQKRDDDGGDQVDHARGKGGKDQRDPAKHGDRVGDLEKGIGGHMASSLDSVRIGCRLIWSLSRLNFDNAKIAR